MEKSTQSTVLKRLKKVWRKHPKLSLSDLLDPHGALGRYDSDKEWLRSVRDYWRKPKYRSRSF